MKQIRKLAPTPSAALQAMVDGLREQSKRPDFKIEMRAFGEVDNDDKPTMCFGCAATCAVQKLTGKNYHGTEILERLDRAHYMDLEYKDMLYFEWAIDEARKGDLDGLIDFYYEGKSDCPDPMNILNKRSWILRGTEYFFALSNTNWEFQLPIVERLITLLKSHGL